MHIAAGDKRWLDRAATVFFEADEQSKPRSLDQSLVSLDVDVYSPSTWGQQRDNGGLARTNGPLLSNFLAALRELVGAQLGRSIDADDYAGHVDASGFH